ncbi:MAG: diguanylate cyclase [Actinomycetota bacterium]
MDANARILVVDNSKTFAALVSAAITDRLNCAVEMADSLAAAEVALARPGGPVCMVITGLVLPDGRDDQVVEFFTNRGLPLVVATGVFDNATRDRILAQPVIDYVLKDAPSSVDYLVWLVDRIRRNRGLTALVVEDSPSMRDQTVAQLALIGFTVIEAANGRDGLAQLDRHPHTRLVVTDYEMPEMDGIEMTRRIRARYGRDRLAIIGVSGSESFTGPLSARFIKNGANDFLAKPFLREELFCRISLNVETIEHLAELREAAVRDYLTGLHNRRAFFDAARKLAKADRHRLTVAMLDIDHFKRINDTLGHDGGDAVLKAVAGVLQAQARSGDLVARFGGEEFCVLAVDLPEAAQDSFFESIRRAVADGAVDIGGRPVAVTTSIGVCATPGPLEAMLERADSALYRAKGAGRNCVIFDVATVPAQ